MNMSRKISFHLIHEFPVKFFDRVPKGLFCLKLLRRVKQRKKIFLAGDIRGVEEV